MRVAIVHTNGQEYLLPAEQVIVYDDTGKPVSVASLYAGNILCCDASHNDFNRVCRSLKIVPLDTNA